MVRGLIQRHPVGPEVFFHTGKGLTGFRIVAECSRLLAEGLHLAESVTNVAEVTQRTGNVSLQNIGVQILGLTAAHRLDEVAVVVAAGAEALNLLAIPREGRAAAKILIATHQVAALAVDDVADSRAAERIGLQAANFEDERGFAIVEHTNLGVGRFAVIDVPE